MAQRILDRILNPKEVSEILNIKLSTLYSHLCRGTELPPYFKVGSQTRWRERDVQEWIERKIKEQKKRNFEI